MAKPFLSFEDQLNKLENEKGLVINNRIYAEKKLREIGYFGLIEGLLVARRAPYRGVPSLS